MSDLPKDDAPDALGAPVDETARTQPWTPATDAGRAGETEQPQKPPARARRPAKAEPHDGGGARQPAPDDADADDARPDDALPAGPAMLDAEVAGSTPPGERIAKVIARAGIASRRDVEAMILAGRVSVNGTTLTSPALNVTDEDRITVDGEPLPARERSRLWIFHKPRGLVTTARDPEGRQTVFEVLPEDVPRVVAIGRLDINTEGLLLLTNDGGLAKVIAHPDTGWLRRYRVRAHGDTDQAQLDQLAKGVTIDGMEYGPVEATLDRVQGDNLWLTLGLREGKNREVKRILEHLGLSVNRLIRLSFGPFQLGDLEVGLVEEIKTRVLKDQLGKSLAEQAGVDFESPVREPIAPFGDGGRKAKGPAETARPARSARDAARPAPVPRVSTGGTGSGPRRSAWRADEDTPNHRPGRAPRRGSDPRAAQAAAAERGRERVGSIKAGERRVVVERLAASAPPTVVEEAPRRRYADRGAPNRPAQTEGGRRDGERGGGRPSHGGETGRRDERSAPRDGGRPKRAYEGAGDARQGERRERPSGDRTDGAPRGGGGFRERQGAGGGRPDAGGRGFSGGKPGPGKGSFGKGSFSKGASGKGAPGKGAPGKGGPGKGAFGKGPSDGARPGPRGGGKPGFSGAKPGGRGGAGGGFRGGGKPGGGGGGRPSRGGR